MWERASLSRWLSGRGMAGNKNVSLRLVTWLEAGQDEFPSRHGREMVCTLLVTC